MPHQPRKRFGQSFLHDPGSIARILAAVAPVPGQRLVEIGPGEGAITTGLLRAAGCLEAIELDRDLLAPLERRCSGLGELRLHNADALRFDFRALAADGPLRVVGNLPYNISTPLLFHLLEQADCIQDMHFLLQKEVVERLAAAPGGRDYGRLSVMVQARCAVQPLFDVGAGAFRPAPKVTSAFVHLVPHGEPPYPIADPTGFARLVAQAFSQRRKTLRNTLRPLLSEAAIGGCGLDPGLRPEQLTVADFARLAMALGGNQPGCDSELRQQR
jgi:16S rRNA (adenine1518-N6/adenine1519-N6)-dimethyltransferase